MDWVRSLPAGVLNQWIAFDHVEPIGDDWRQTASIVRAVLIPAFANASAEFPDVDDFMPDHYLRPKKKLSSVLFQSPEDLKQIAQKAKAVFGRERR
jgi:hypothetical protein